MTEHTPIPSEQHSNPEQPLSWRMRVLAYVLHFGVRLPYRIARKLLSWGIKFALLATLILFIAVHTDPVRLALGTKIQEVVNKALAGKIYFDDFGGNPLTGFTFDNITLIAGGDTVVTAKKLTLRYDILPLLLSKNITAEYIEFEKARIFLHWDTAGVINLAKIAHPSDDDDSTSTPFPFTISAHHISFTNTDLRMLNERGDTTLIPGSINFANAHFKNLNLNLGATADINTLAFTGDIRHIGFKEKNSGFTLQQASALVLLDTTTAEIAKGSIQTNKSRLALEARVRQLNIFRGFSDEELSRALLTLTLRSDSVSGSDIQAFVPDVNFIGKARLLADGDGTLQKLNVRQLLIQPDEESELRLSGVLTNIVGEGEFSLAANASSSVIDYADLKRVVPGLSLPDLAFLKGVQIDSVIFEGKPLDFYARGGINTTFGKVRVDGTLNLLAPEIEYDVALATERLNLAVPLQNSNVASSLTLSATVRGSGTSLQTACSEIVLFAQPSSFLGKNIQSVHLNGGVCEGGVIRIDTAHIAWRKERQNDSVPYNSSVGIGGKINLRNTENPIYEVRTSVERFNLQDISPKLPATSFTGFVEATGASLDIDKSELLLCADLPEFTINDKQLSHLHLQVEATTQESGERLVEIRSEPLDLRVEGQFTVESLVGLAADQAGIIAKYAESNVEFFTDNGKITPFPADTVFSALRSEEPLQAQFAIRSGDVQELLSLIGIEGFAELATSGVIERYKGGSHILLDSLRIRKMELQTPTVKIGGESIAGDIDIRFSTTATGFFQPFGKIYLTSDSVFTVDETVLGAPSVKASFANDSAAIQGGVSISDVRIWLGGKVHKEREQYPFTFDTVSVKLNNVEWSSQQQAKGFFSPLGVHFQSMALRRGTKERILVKGVASPSDFKDLSLRIEGFNLADVHSLTGIEPLALLSGQLSKADILLNGEFQRPNISLQARADSVSYNKVLIGNQVVTFDYKDFTVKGSSSIISDKKDTVLSCLVEQLPFDLSFMSVDERLIDGKPISIKLFANNVSLATVAPFVPSVNDFTGIADASFSIIGTTPADIRYIGEATIKQCSFILQSTNLAYSVTGKAYSTNNIINLKDIVLRNKVSDLPGGKADIIGSVRVEGFDIAEVDFTITSERLLVLSNSSKAVSPKIYGDMIIATGTTPLRFYGSFSKPFIRGDINILRANVYYPEDKSVQRSQSLFCYETVRDSVGQTKIVGRNCGDEYYGDITKSIQTPYKQYDTSSVGTELFGPFMPKGTVTSSKQAVAPSKTFIDLLDIDVNVTFGGTFFVTMDLGPFEQLVAEVGQENIKEPLRYRQLPDEGKKQLFGSLRVKEGSSYKFYRVFKATGLLSFPTGDISNPKLDLRAVLDAQRIMEGARLQPYRVLIEITGTKLVPDVAISYTIDGALPSTAEKSQIQTNAILLLVLGKTQEELQVGSGTGSSFNERTIANQGISSVATSILSDILQGTGIIRSAGVTFDETNDGSVADFSRARLQLTGEISSLGIVWNYGSSVADVGNSSSFTVDIPLGFLFDAEALRNLVLTISRTANMGTNLNRFQKDWEVRMGYRF